MQQRTVFGHRTSLPFATAAASSPSPTALPIRIEKDIGANALTLLGAGAFAVFFTVVPLLFGHMPLKVLLFHSDMTYVIPGLIILLPVLYRLSRNPAELDISAQGIRVATKSGRWSYAWADIDDIASIPKSQGVRLNLKGRTDEQNRYNVIPGGFGPDFGQLSAIVNDGIQRFGNRPVSMQTMAPGDDIQAARMRTLKQTLQIYGLILGCIFAVITLWQALECLKTLELQKNGRAAEARVIRIYTSGCGKHGCSLDVEYTFAPENTGTEYRGYEWIGSDRSPNAPNLVYARTNHTVPIVYDVNKPAVSSLNFHNHIFEQDPVSETVKFLGIIAGVFGLIMLFFLALLTPLIFRLLRASD